MLGSVLLSIGLLTYYFIQIISVSFFTISRQLWSVITQGLSQITLTNYYYNFFQC